MALSMGISKKTVQNWEKGLSSPNLFQATEWFKALGLNPTKYYLEFLYPTFFDDMNSRDEAKLDEILINLIKNISIVEKKELIYLISGMHGSSWPALIQLFSAYCQMSLQARVIVANIILENYEMEEKMGKLVDKNEINPDFELLKSAVISCKIAAQNGHLGYSTMFFNEIKTQENKS